MAKRRSAALARACESGSRPRAGSACCSAIAGAVAIFTSGVLGYYYVQFSRIIEARLHGERDRVIPRVFARPLTLHTGQGLSEVELIARLNDVGYTERARVERPGEFALDRRAVVLVPRGGDSRRQAGAHRVRRAQSRHARRSGRRRQRRRIGSSGSRPAAASVDEVALDPPMLSGLVTRLAREAAARAARDHSGAHAAGGARHRRSPLLRAPRHRSDQRRRRRLDQPQRRSPLAGRPQHGDAAAVADVLPERRVQRRAAVAASGRIAARRSKPSWR